MGRMLLTVSLSLAGASCLALAGADQPTSASAAHPDGSLAWRVGLDRLGQRDGAFTAYWPGGNIVAERATYRRGLLHGLRQRCDAKGQSIADETWNDGLLIHPLSKAQLDAGLARIATLVNSATVAAELSTSPTMPSKAHLAGLIRLRQYRWLAGVDTQVRIDNTLTAQAQAGADLLARLGRLDHHPSKPAELDAGTFALADKGCATSNLAMGLPSLEAAIDAWMDDSDAANVNALGHRRWMINVSMGKTGFGATGRVHLISAHDQTNPRPAQRSWVAWPPPGLVPVRFFPARAAWNITLDPAAYKGGAVNATMAIYALDQKFSRFSPVPLTLEIDKADGDGYGAWRNHRVIRPVTATKPGPGTYSVSPGRSYEVVVGNLTPHGHRPGPTTIRYVVTFCD